jgi:hypothetical protein
VTSSIFLFAQDVLDEGLGHIVDAGLDGITIAATYHHARDVLPHNPLRKVSYTEGGVTYFEPTLDRYGLITPAPSRNVNAFGEAQAAARQHGLSTSAWLVVLHNSRLAERYPHVAQRTAFGDQLVHALCPAQPAVREFAIALATDVARFELQAIKLEAVSYMPFDHGGHHERSFVPLSPNVRFLLGLCLCAACSDAATADGIDIKRLQADIQRYVQAVFDSASNETHEAEPDDDWLHAFADGALGRFAATRQRIVASLVQQITDAVHAARPSTRVIYLDPSGASLGYATGRPSTTRLATQIAWRDGLDLGALARAADGIGMLGYFADPARFQRELAAYRELGTDLEVVLRPMPPDTSSAEALQTRVASLRGVRDVSFYHYGFMRLENLGWIKAALGQP